MFASNHTRSKDRKCTSFTLLSIYLSFSAIIVAIFVFVLGWGNFKIIGVDNIFYPYVIVLASIFVFSLVTVILICTNLHCCKSNILYSLAVVFSAVSIFATTFSVFFLAFGAYQMKQGSFDVVVLKDIQKIIEDYGYNHIQSWREFQNDHECCGFDNNILLMTGDACFKSEHINCKVVFSNQYSLFMILLASSFAFLDLFHFAIVIFLAITISKIASISFNRVEGEPLLV
ncbi:hypothetical protein WA158_005753 [Blastocystis sp. Blastoise]